MGRVFVGVFVLFVVSPVALTRSHTVHTLSICQYNADETTTSLVYAARVKLIKNEAKKESDSEAVAYLKKIIHEFETQGSSKTLQAKGIDGKGGGESKS